MDSILQTALAEAVNSLASFFGTTTEAIMTRAPEFLAKYGWYSTLNNLPQTIFISLLFALLFFLLIVLIKLGDIDHPVLIGTIVIFTWMVVGVGTELVTCAVAPEIVGVHAIMDLLKNMNYMKQENYYDF